MNMPGIEFLRDRLKLLVRLSYGVLALLIVIDAIPALTRHRPRHRVRRLP